MSDSPDSRLATTDLPHAIEKAIARAAELLEGVHVSVIAEYPAHLPVVQGEHEQLFRVVTSLVVAAAQSAREGEIRVKAEISSGPQAPADSSPQPVSGEGSETEIPWAQVSISMPLFQAADGASESLRLALQTDPPGQPERPAGSLQSLAECRSTIERFGGKLWIDPPGPSGPCIRFALPLRAAQAAHPDVSELRSLVEAHLPNGEEPVRTLLALVEDEVLLGLLSQDLGEAGFRVVATQDGGEVLGLARSEQPDLVLLDMMARDPAALDVAMVLKKDQRTLSIPVLFLSSIADAQAGEMRLGAASFLVRPVGTGALISTIQTVLGSGIAPSGRVLVVESDEAARETIVMMIQAHGYRVTEAAAPEEALALAEHVPPDLALINASMAQEGDYWLLRGLRRIGRDFEIIVLAEAYSEADRQAAVDRGASGYSETGKLSQLLDEMRKRRGGA